MQPSRLIIGLCAAFALTLAALLPMPASAAKIDDQFKLWLDKDLWPEAQKLGVSRQNFDIAFKNVRPNLDLPDLILPGQKDQPPQKQHQAEFGAPGAYFAEKTIAGVVNGGRPRAQQFKSALAAAEKRFGAPGPIILAIWGRESGFGTARIPYDAFEVLGTKAFLARRKEMFRKEVLAALVMLQGGKVTRDDMKSSWAGALGQPQFMPSNFLKHAVDMDGDGHIDIWNSVPDTLGSIGNYLAHYGWQKGRDWGFEVSVPANLSCALEGLDRGKRIADWSKLGVARIGGKPFPKSELAQEGYLLMPAGTNGPAFIVTPNFYRLKDYNESDLYALFVGHTGDRIAGSSNPFNGNWGKVDKLLRSDIASLQRGLEALGYDVGGADGLQGFRTRRSIGEWQAKNGLAPTCFPSASLVKSLR